MGQKMDPHGLRVGIIKDWSSISGESETLCSINPNTGAATLH